MQLSNMKFSNMKFWGNVIGYQIVWFSAVIGAGRGLWWPGVSTAVVFATLHFALLRQSRALHVVDLQLMAIALACGLLMDGGLAGSGLAEYAANPFPLLPGSPPVWLLSIWAAFALTLRHSMTFLLGRPLIGLLLGAVGGPLAYLGAARGWGAIDFAEPRWMPIVALVFGWSIAIPLLTTLALRWSSAINAPCILPTGEAR